MNFNTLLLLGLGGLVLVGMRDEHSAANSTLSCDDCRRLAEQSWPRNAYGYHDRGSIMAAQLPPECAPARCSYRTIRPNYTARPPERVLLTKAKKL
ncbi:MAG: hypothetical protein V3S01_04890 [Dehalococcoidia bacterium]